MKLNLITIATLVLLTPSFAFATPQQAPTENVERTQKAGRIGCAVGGVLGAVAGNKLLKDNKAIGTVAGAGLGCAGGNFFGKKWSKSKQLKEFREAQRLAESAGMTTHVVEVEEKNDKGKNEKALGSLTINYQAEDMNDITGKTEDVFNKLANISTQSKNELTFTFHGKRNCEKPMQELAKRDAFKGDGVEHRVVNRCGSGDSKIVITPIPDIQ